MPHTIRTPEAMLPAMVIQLRLNHPRILATPGSSIDVDDTVGARLKNAAMARPMASDTEKAEGDQRICSAFGECLLASSRNQRGALPAGVTWFLKIEEKIRGRIKRKFALRKYTPTRNRTWFYGSGVRAVQACAKPQ